MGDAFWTGSAAEQSMGVEGVPWLCHVACVAMAVSFALFDLRKASATAHQTGFAVLPPSPADIPHPCPGHRQIRKHKAATGEKQADVL